MNNLIIALHDILNRIKDFQTAYTTRNKDSMIIEYKNKRYVIHIEEIEGQSENMIDDVRIFLE